MAALADRVRRAVPSSLGARIRWLFAAFPTLVAGLFVPVLWVSELAFWPGQTVVLLCLGAIVGWVWAQYRRDGLTLPWDVLPIAAIFVLRVMTGGAGSGFGLMFVLLFSRSLYGPIGRVWINALGYFIAFEAGTAVTAGVPALLGVDTVTTGFGLIFTAGVMWLLGDMIRVHERESRRGEVLAHAASALHRARSHDEVYDIGVATGIELVRDEAGSVVTWWRGDTTTLRLLGHAEVVPDDQPTEFRMADFPQELRESLLRGEPFEMDERAMIEAQRAMGIEELRFTSCLLVPLGHGQDFGGVLAAASRLPLPSELIASLERLAADVGLALELADSSVLLRQVVDNSSDAILLVDAELTIDFTSPAVRSVLGSGPAEIRGRPLAELFAEEQVELEAVLDGAARASARRDPYVFSMCHGDGSIRQIELAATPLPEGRRRGWVLNLRDVTRRMETERELVDSQQRLRALAEGVSEGLYRVALVPEARFEYVNPAMEEMTGFPAGDFLADASLVLRRIHPDDLDLVRRTRLEPDSVEWPAEVRWRHPERGWRWLSLRETAIVDADGTATSTMGILSDITARKQQEEALHSALENERRVIEALRRVDAMRTTFLQAVSHELRTPLTTIVGFTQTLNRADGRLDDARRAMMLDRLEANARKLDQLLSDLLDVDRLSSGAIEPVRSRLDVAGLCRRVIDQTPTPTHPVTAPTGTVIAEVDAPKVERIIVNLLGNAVKHTEPGTPIDITVEPAGPGDGALITVQDHGNGVPLELHGSIFDPFVQGPESSSSPQPGTGIGLSLVARFAELHGGRAWLEPSPDGGSRFRVLLHGPEPAGGMSDDRAPGLPVPGISALRP